MSIRTLPQIKAFERPEGLETDGLDPAVLDRWNAGLRPAASGDGTVIDIFDVIGEDIWSGGGVTVKSVKQALAASSGPVTVNINSPGGDYFEGLAIYNTLREHSARVNINIMGLAASAASVIAMAGDKTRIASAGFLMIHNCWVLAIGDRHDLSHAARTMEQFDGAMAGLYAARSGKAAADVTAWMDAETWFSGEQAVENGFADALLPSDAVKQDTAARGRQQPVMALRRTDAILARQGITKTERRRLLNEIKSGTSGAAAHKAMQDAGMSALVAELRGLHATINPSKERT